MIDRRAESGSNVGQAQQLKLRKEKEGCISNAALMLCSPVGSQQTPGQKQLSTKHFMEENRLSRGLVKVEII